MTRQEPRPGDAMVCPLYRRRDAKRPGSTTTFCTECDAKLTGYARLLKIGCVPYCGQCAATVLSDHRLMLPFGGGFVPPDTIKVIENMKASAFADGDRGFHDRIAARKAEVADGHGGRRRRRKR